MTEESESEEEEKSGIINYSVKVVLENSYRVNPAFLFQVP